VIRTVIVTLLAIGTYVLFMRGLGTRVLHYPAIKGHYGGNPLSWMDWLILVLLWYTVAFGSYGSTRIRRTVARQLDDQFRGQSPAVG
jgi:AAT family amino acid transporter